MARGGKFGEQDREGPFIWCYTIIVIAYLSMGASNAVAASCTCRCADLRSLCTIPISFIQPPPWLPIPPECHIIAASPKAKHHTILKTNSDDTINVQIERVNNILWPCDYCLLYIDYYHRVIMRITRYINSSAAKGKSSIQQNCYKPGKTYKK